MATGLFDAREVAVRLGRSGARRLSGRDSSDGHGRPWSWRSRASCLLSASRRRPPPAAPQYRRLMIILLEDRTPRAEFGCASILANLVVIPGSGMSATSSFLCTSSRVRDGPRPARRAGRRRGVRRGRADDLAAALRAAPRGRRRADHLLRPDRSALREQDSCAFPARRRRAFVH